MITMADSDSRASGLAKKLQVVGSSLGWFEKPVDDLIAKISRETNDFKLDDSIEELKKECRVSPKQIIAIDDDDDDGNDDDGGDDDDDDDDDRKDSISCGQLLDNKAVENGIRSPKTKANDDSPFLLPHKSLRERVLKKYNPEHSTGSDSDDLESFFDKVRTPKPPRFNDSPQDCVQSSKQEDLDDFIVQDDLVLLEEDNECDDVFLVEDDSDEEKENLEEFLTPLHPPQRITGKTVGYSWKTPTSTRKTQPHPATDKPRRPCSALESIVTPYSTQKEFKSNKDTLVKQLFQLYNETVFDEKLPSDFGITWNNRMRSTAGFCYYGRKNGVSTARIELADKVIDSADRLRDTLIHEMCHAATWLINGVRAGHGPIWKNWARRANFIHKDLAPISRCHSYKINAKYIYHCTNEFCSNSIGRHSKSLDLEKYRCAYCHSRFQLQPQLKKDGTPHSARTPNRFAQFVKENYSKVRKTGMAHKDVMKELSSQFSLMSTK